jgi:hypothetical protein
LLAPSPQQKERDRQVKSTPVATTSGAPANGDAVKE